MICPCLRKSLRSPRGKDIRRRRRRPEHVAKAIDSSALKIDAGKQRHRDALLTLTQQPPSLLRALDIAREENDSRRLQPPKQGSEPRRHLGAVEANNQKLP